MNWGRRKSSAFLLETMLSSYGALASAIHYVSRTFVSSRRHDKATCCIHLITSLSSVPTGLAGEAQPRGTYCDDRT